MIKQLQSPTLATPLFKSIYLEFGDDVSEEGTRQLSDFFFLDTFSVSRATALFMLARIVCLARTCFVWTFELKSKMPLCFRKL